MIQCERTEPAVRPRSSRDERDHDIRNALSVARLPLDLVRRRLQRAPSNGADLDSALERVRGSIDCALDVPIDRDGARAELADVDGFRGRLND